MKTIILTIILVTAFIAVDTTLAQAQSPEQLYQKGLMKEEGEGDLQEAIALFNKVADNSNADQSLRAKALLHVGMCYEKMGNEGAIKAYQRLVSSYPAQKDEVAVARERLLSLTKTEKKGEVSIRQIWAGLGTDDFGSASADGELLSFTEWETGNLAVRNLKTGENRLITDDASWIDSIQYAEYSLISPDGKQFAHTWYYKNLNYQLRLTRGIGQKPTVLYSCKGWDEYISPDAWFADGKRILAQLSRRPADRSRSIQFVIFSTSSGDMEIIKETQPGPPFLANLSLSPDEKYLAYDLPVASDNGMFDINIINLDTKQDSTLIQHPANDRLLGWLPGRNEMLFVSDRLGTKDIWALTVSDGKPSGVPRRILNNTGDVNPMGFTGDGSLLFSISTTAFESFIAPLDSQSGEVSINSRTPISGARFGCTWLPDGESMIFTEYNQNPSAQTQTRINMVIVNTKTGQSRNLAENLNTAGHFRISPDGKSVIALARDQQRLNEQDYRGGLYIVDIESGLVNEVKTSHDATRAFTCEWDREGQNIFYFSDKDLVKHDLNTGDEKVIYSAENVAFPSLTRSYDGNNILFDVVKDMNNNLFHLLSVPVTGGEADTLSTYQSVGSTRFKRIALSPDGKYIYLTTRAPGVKSVLSRIPSTGGAPENLWQSAYYFISGISIHPQGDRIALSTFETAREIRIIDNLDEKVTEVFTVKE